MTTTPPLSTYRPWTYRIAVVLVAATFGLIVLGGTVTSKGVGLAVPDWPTTFGYNMFGVPLATWIGRGGVFWEHLHRLAGSAVGVITIIVAQLIWLPYLNTKLPYRLAAGWPFLCRSNANLSLSNDRPWLRWLAVGALALVIIQGVMGGLRVTEMSVTLAVLHGVTAQLFLCVTVLIASATSRLWLNATQENTPECAPNRYSHKLRRLSLGLLAVMVIQLVLGATMRHTGSRLAIPDFPSAYGQLWPPMTDSTIRAAINKAPYEQFDRYYGVGQVGVHFSHRVWAVAVFAMFAVFAKGLGAEMNKDQRLTTPMLTLACLLIAQIALGALVIWTGQSDWNNEFATAHQGTGAALLATATVLAIRVHVLPPPPIRHTSTDTPAATASLKGAPA